MWVSPCRNASRCVARRRNTAQNATRRRATRRERDATQRGVARGSWLVARGSTRDMPVLKDLQTSVCSSDWWTDRRIRTGISRVKPRATSYEPRATSHEPRRVASRRFASRRSTSCCVVRCVAVPRNATRCVMTRRNSHFKRNGAAIFKSEM